MLMIELAAEYRYCARRIKERVKELKRRLYGVHDETEKYLLRGRIHILESMAREAEDTARYMEKYYGKGK